MSTPCVGRLSPETSNQVVPHFGRPSSAASSGNTHVLSASRTASMQARPAARWSAWFSPATNSTSQEPVTTTSGVNCRITRAMSRRRSRE